MKPFKLIKSFYKPVIRILREMRDEAKAGDVIDLAVDERSFSEQDLSGYGGQSFQGIGYVRQMVHWARKDLVAAGYLCSPKYGVWGLTDEGKSLDLDSVSDEDIRRKAESAASRAAPTHSQPTEEIEIAPSDDTTKSLPAEEKKHTRFARRIAVLAAVKFERLCCGLIEKMGFVKVRQTPATGDGGFDGYAVWSPNPLVEISLIFDASGIQRRQQCSARHCAFGARKNLSGASAKRRHYYDFRFWSRGARGIRKMRRAYCAN